MFLESVLRGAEALAARDPVGTLPDPELLRRFAADRDPNAFAVLVRRHGPLVWGVCRNMLAADADAEDAFQATFLALVRSAGSIRRTDALGGWLHGVAYRVAMKARRSAIRRKQRESFAAVPEPDSPVSDAAWDELQAAVHEEVCKLPDKLRMPFVLCGLQGRPQKDAAKQLGWPIGTLSARLTLARQRLLDRLARRGVPVSVAAGAAVLGATSGSAAVPTSIAMSALAVAGSPDSVSPVVTTLARGVTNMYLTRTKMLVAGVVVAGLLTTGVGSQLMSSADAQAPNKREAEAEQIRRALEFIKASQAAHDRWEYKFVAVKSTLDAAELQKMLRAHDQEGWEYCGSQNLAVSGTPVSHLTFKRPVQAVSKNQTEAGLADLAAALQERGNKDTDAAAKAELLKQFYERVGKKGAAEFYEALKKKELDAQAAKDEELRARERAELEYARAIDAERRAKASAEAKAFADQERDRAKQLELQLKQLKQEQEMLLLKLKELQQQRSDPEAKSPASSDSAQAVLKYVKAREAIEMLAKVVPDVKVARVDEAANSILLRGSPDTIAKVQGVIKQIDVPAAAKPGPPEEKIVISVVPLKHIDGKTAAAAIAKTITSAKLSVTAEPTPNSVILAGYADAVAMLRKAIEELDVTGGRPK
jgi:RNA polymerase sigma factor (sigma-70 family)